MRTTTRTEMLTTWTLNLNGFNPARGICAMLAVGLVAFGASTPRALAISTNATYDGAVGNWDRDTWNTASNWEPQQVPDDGVATPWEVIIAAGKFVSVSENYSGVVTPVYTGNLTLQSNATLWIAHLSTDADLRALAPSGSDRESRKQE